MSKDLVGVHNNTWSIPDGVRATAQQEAHRTRISTSALPPGDPFVLRVTDPCRRVDTTLRRGNCAVVGLVPLSERSGRTACGRDVGCLVGGRGARG